MKKYIATLVAMVIGVVGLGALTTPASAVECDAKVSQDSAAKVVDVATSAEQMLGWYKYRKVQVTAKVHHTKCYDPGGNYVWSRINWVQVGYHAQRRNVNVVSGLNENWHTNSLNCSDGVRDNDWFTKVETLWEDQGLGGWQPPMTTVACSADGTNSKRYYPADGDLKVYASNTTPWVAKTYVVREALRLNYYHRLEKEVK